MFLLFLATIFTYVNVPVATMREEASIDSRVASQAVYSEPVTALEEKNGWIKIQTAEKYEGWVKKEDLHFTNYSFIDYQGVVEAKVNRTAAHLYHVKDTEYGPIKTLPFESRLEVLDQFGDPHGRWLQVKLVDGTTAYIQRGDIRLNPQTLSFSEAVALSKIFLDLPYTWGGKSSFGYDCSGFVQMIYRQAGIQIPRDSKQQVAWEGFKEVALNELQLGDLIFFGKEKPKVTHVGLYLGENQFIHSTVADNKPYLQISDLNEKTWNSTGLYTYRVARRLK